MRCRTRSVAVLAALVLLTSAATAYAECAWVLWVYEAYPAGRSDMKIISAAPTHAECMSAARNAADLQAASIPVLQPGHTATTLEPRFSGGGYGVSNQGPSKDEPAEWSMVFKCFPDTVDPRGLKGK